MMREPGSSTRLRRIQEARQILEIVAEYVKEGKISTIVDASEGELSPSTIRSWISEPKKLEKAYKLESLLKLGPILSSISDHNGIAYDLALREWGTDRAEQASIFSYEGKFNLYHNLPIDYTSNLNNILINPFKKRSYHNFYISFDSNSQSRSCDGFAFIEKRRIRLTGVYHKLVFYAIFSMPITYDPYYGEGSFLIEDSLSDRRFFAKCAIVKPYISSSKQLIEMAHQYVNGDAQLL